jgi:hypothetical protein
MQRSGGEMIDDSTWRLLQKIGNPLTKRLDVAQAYRYAIQFGEDVEWDRVHQAIVHRWSHFAVEWIRREAKRAVDEYGKGEK